MTTTIYSVSSAAQLSAAIAAIDSASTGSGATFEIDIAAGATLTETAALPAIDLNGCDSLTIQGNGGALDGGGQYQGLNVTSGTVTVDNLTIQNAVVTGGANGGYGLGGGLYVGTGANVTLDDVTFANDGAVGGNGGTPGTGSGGPGVAAGADIFQIQGGTLTIEGGNLGVGTVTGGVDLSGNLGNAWGTGIFIQGSNTLTLAPTSGETLTITGVITDEHGLVSADVNEADLIIDGGGTVILSPELSNSAATANTFTGGISLDSGTLELTSAQAAGSGAIWFGYAGNGNPVPTLKLDAGAFTNGSFANCINGYDVGDTIDFAGVSAQSVAYNSQAQTLTVGGETVNLALQTYLTSSEVRFVTSSDGHGGTDVTLAKLANPTISGTVAGQTTTNGAALDPFAKVTICDPNAGASETLFITLSGSGTLKDGAGFSGLGTSGAASGIYVLQGSAACVTKELDALVFTPAAGAPNSSAETTFTLQDVSSVGTSTSNGCTTVTNTDAAVASVISGTVAGQVVGVAKTIDPFAHAVISDANANSTDAVYIDVSSGTLSDGAGFSGLTASSVAGLYSIKAQSAAQATAEVEALVYTPAPTTSPTGVSVQFVVQNSAGIVTSNSTTSLTVDPGPKTGAVSETLVDGTSINLTSAILGAATAGLQGDTLTISAVNGKGTLGSYALVNGQLTYTASSTAANTSVHDSLGYTITDEYGDTATGTVNFTINNPVVAPTISGTAAGQIVGAQKTIDPFAHVTIGDANANSTDSVYIDISGGGTLSDGAGFSGLTATSVAGLYSIKAQTAAQATAEVDALVYTPAPGTRSATSVGFELVDQDSAGLTATNTSTTLTVDPGPTTGKLAETLVEGTGIDLTSAVLAAATPGLKGDTLSITAVNGNGTLGNFALVNGELIYAASTPALTQLGANCTASDTLGYTISDQYGDTATGSVALTITNPQATTTSSSSNLLGSLLGSVTSLLGSVSSAATNLVDNLTSSFATLSGGDACTTVQDALGNACVTLGNGNDSILAAGLGNKITLGCGTDLISKGQGLETIVLGAGTDTVNLGGTCNNVTLNGSHATVCGGQGSDTVTVNGGSDNLTFAGSSSLASICGISSINICDLGSALTVKIGSSTQNDCITGFGTSDTLGVVDLLNGCGGYASTAQIMNNLHSDGHGGTMLSLGSNCSIDFAGTALSQLHASNFRIG